MNLRVWLCTLLTAASLFAAAPASERAARQVIIKWRSLPVHLDAAEMLPDYAARTEDFRVALPIAGRTDQGLERISVLTANTLTDAQAIVAGLANDRRVEYAELRPQAHTDEIAVRGRRGGGLDGVPNDPFYTQQWALQKVEAEAAWDITRGDTSVVIAVVDVGVDFSHPDLAAQRWVNWAEVHGQAGVDDDGDGYVDDYYGYDFEDGDGDPTPNPLAFSDTHGTHVAGIAAATRNNGIGIAGVAPGCRVMGVRVGSGVSVDFGYEGIYYACRAGAKVINCSWGGGGDDGYQHDVLDYVAARGCVVVAAAGNAGNNIVEFPAGIEGVLSTAATDIGDLAATFTSYGPWVKISAPGVMIYSTTIGRSGGHGYEYFSGTSMAAPMATGVCALVASRFPGFTGRQIMERVASSADPIDTKNPSFAGKIGLGRINAWRALSDSVAGVRLAGIQYTEVGGNQDGRIRGGETADLQVSIYNDLGTPANVTAHVYTDSDSLGVVRPDAGYGVIGAGGPFVNQSPITIQVIGTAQRGPMVPIYVDFLGPNAMLIGRGTATVILDSTFVVVDNGTMKLGFAENGSLGYFDYTSGRYVGPGWKLGDHTNGLYHGSVFVAADGAVSDNFYGNSTGTDSYDWVALSDSVAHVVPSSRADYEAHASFDDRGAPGATRLFAKVQAAGLGWYSPGTSGALVLEYRITNPSANAWNRAYAGLFLDVDLATALSNVANYDSASQITYVRQVYPTHPLVGVVPLTDSLGGMYIIDNRAQIDAATWNDTTKWQLITGGIHPVPSQPLDLSVMVTVKPFTLAAGSSRTVAFALLSGQSLEELKAAADSARQRYAPAAIPPHPPITQRSAVAAQLYPNPLTQGEALHVRLPSAEPVTVRFYNILGQEVAVWQGSREGKAVQSLDRDVLRGASGLLFYRIESPSARVAGKLLIVK